MKKISYIFIIILLFSTISGCNFQDAKYINLSTKPNNHYYVDEIKNKILSNNKFTLYVFDTNLYKEIEVPSEEKSIMESFISSLTDNNYSEETTDKKEPYRIKIIFDDNSQYILKVFDDSLVSVSPWDGNYKEDMVSIKDLPLRYNLFDFCNHIANEPLSK
ncbi:MULTISPECIES: DUF4883 family protein [unclassified Clostridium]|uniref:DUF4883 family protein n=1 Tax=unclassified Clostridium TaxID=2614128 RepID=UPI000297B54D|nr:MULTISPECIES: DUF4883 family protein [unclassified Clostridium]EKQ53040.1 MAG: hypothetical protein A370_03892 [Clostridium sp. Maddingley MBC34-26]